MTLAYYMDVHIPAAVTAGLRLRGIDVLTTQEDQYGTADDESLLARATEIERVLVTQDHDFLAIAAEWQSSRREFSGIVFARQLAMGIGLLIEDLELIAVAAEPEEVHGRVTHLPLR